MALVLWLATCVVAVLGEECKGPLTYKMEKREERRILSSKSVDGETTAWGRKVTCQGYFIGEIMDPVGHTVV